MKKFLKTLAVCFMALISCFTFFACNEPNNPETPNNPEQSTPSEGTTPSQTTAQTNEANYTKMKNMVTNVVPENGFKLEITEENSSSATVDYTGFDYTAMGMTEDEFNEFKAEMDESMEEEMEGSEIFKDVIAYNATDKTGYTLKYEGAKLKEYTVSTANTLYLGSIENNEQNGSDESDESDGSESNLMTASEGDGEENPETTPTYTYNKYKFNVDDKYFNQYIYDFNDEIGMMLKTIVQDSINDLETAMTKTFSEMGLTGEPTTTINCTESDGVTTMVITSSLENIPSFNMGYFELKNFSMVLTMEIKFNATKVLSIDGKNAMSGTMSMDLSEMFEEDGDEGAPAVPVLTINMVMNADTKYVFDEYNDTDKPAITDSEFRGTGAENAVEDRTSNVVLYIDGVNYLCISKTMNDTFDKANIFNERGDETNYSEIFTDLENITWYIDKDCTIPYTGTKFTSYDIKLYAKLSDMGLAEGKALYRSLSITSYDEGINYSDYFDKGLQVGSTSEVVVDGTNYTCAYVNGKKFNAGESYTLDATKINQIIFVSKSNENQN